MVVAPLAPRNAIVPPSAMDLMNGGAGDTPMDACRSPIERPRRPKALSHMPDMVSESSSDGLMTSAAIDALNTRSEWPPPTFQRRLEPSENLSDGLAPMVSAPDSIKDAGAGAGWLRLSTSAAALAAGNVASNEICVFSSVSLLVIRMDGMPNVIEKELVVIVAASSVSGM